jgi:hypothetical protein
MQGLRLYAHGRLPAPRIVYAGGRRLLQLLGACHKAAVAGEGARDGDSWDEDDEEGGLGLRGCLGGVGEGAGAGAAQRQEAEVAEEVATLLDSLLRRFADSAAAGDGGERGDEGAGEAARRVLLVENLEGSLTQMQRAACDAERDPGRRLTNKAAREEREALLAMDTAAVARGAWLWLLALALRRGWHVQLAQTREGAAAFLQAAAGRAEWQADRLAGRGAGGAARRRPAADADARAGGGAYADRRASQGQVAGGGCGDTDRTHRVAAAAVAGPPPPIFDEEDVIIID